MKPTHYRNKTGHLVEANAWLHADWKNLELEPVYENAPAPVIDNEKTNELRALTVTELRAKCKDAGLTGYSKMNEQELIDVLLGL